jgi:sulfoxide reductase heme-binding subunit YedZ
LAERNEPEWSLLPVNQTFKPWLDYRGRPSFLRLAVLAALLLPAIWTLTQYQLDLLGPRALNAAIHQIGLWTIRLLFLALAVTPLRQILKWPGLIEVRRMIGVASFAYGLLHFSLYAADEAFDLAKVAGEIVLRIYLTLGFVTLIGLTLLAATSTDAMVRRLGGRRWRRLHRIVYALALIAVVHHFMQSKLDEWEPTVMAGLYVWLMGYRLAQRVTRAQPLPIWSVGLLGVLAGLATALIETAYYAVKLHAPAAILLAANLGWDSGLRPSWVVLAIGLALWLGGAARAAAGRRNRPDWRTTAAEPVNSA